MSKEYIDRDECSEDIRKRFCESCDRRKGMKNGKMRVIYKIGEAPCRACWIDDARALIEDFPAADVEKRAKGAWVERYTVTTDNEAIGYYSCSKCEFRSGWIYNFCPRCGADMRGTP